MNFQRKSVTGLSFDFLLLNITGNSVVIVADVSGYIGYTLYNCILYWDVTVQREYEQLHHSTTIPVQPNDVAFAIHAFILTCFQIGQCFIYDVGIVISDYNFPAWRSKNTSCHNSIKRRNDIRNVSTITLGRLRLHDLVPLYPLLELCKSWMYLVKVHASGNLPLSTALISKAYSNYKRQSTIGWSIGNVLLDITGGLLSFAQQFIDAFNSGLFVTSNEI